MLRGGKGEASGGGRRVGGGVHVELVCMLIGSHVDWVQARGGGRRVGGGAHVDWVREGIWWGRYHLMGKASFGGEGSI